MRVEVQQFAELMNERLEENSHKDKVGWAELSRLELIDCIAKNCFNVHTPMNKEDLINHAVDIANYAMMIADNCRRGESE